MPVLVDLPEPAMTTLPAAPTPPDPGVSPDPPGMSGVPDDTGRRSLLGGDLRQLVLFYGLVFAVTWGLAAALFLAPDVVTGPGGIDSGRGKVSFFVAVWAPTSVAFVLTLLQHGVRRGLLGIVRGMVAPGGWRTAWWLLVGAYVIPVAWLVAFLLSRIGGSSPADAVLDVGGLFLVVPATILTTTFLLVDPGALGEEYGWRGYALPRLLRLTNPTMAGAVVGGLMALWHVPSFYAAQLVQSDLSFLLMSANWVGWGVVSAWVYQRSGGNWVAAGVLPHAMLNCAYMLGVAYIDWITGTGALLAAVAITALRRHEQPGATQPHGRAEE